MNHTLRSVVVLAITLLSSPAETRAQAPLVVTAGGLQVNGPALLRWEVATTLEAGFDSSLVAPAFGLPSRPALYELWSSQEFGLWNGCAVQLQDGESVTITPALLPVNLRWRLEVNGVRRTPGAGLNGFVAADQNLDGFVNGLDADVFANWFDSGDGRADFNGDGFVDGMDSDAFANEWATR